MRQLIEIIVAYAKPPNPNGYERIDWKIESFSLEEDLATSFELFQKKNGLLADKLYHFDYGYEHVWEDKFGRRLVVAGKQTYKLSDP